VKVGGDVNNFALTSYFLMLGVTSLVTLVLTSLEPAERLAILLCSGICLVVIILNALAASNAATLHQLTRRLADPSDNSQEMAYRYLRDHPREAYFPWNPLPAVYLEGRLYHFEWGIIDRYLANPDWVDADHVDQMLAHMPEDCRLVAMPEVAKTTFSLRFFEGIAKGAPIPQLPGFQIHNLLPTTQPGTQPQ
jgi:hypothetical protein